MAPFGARKLLQMPCFWPKKAPYRPSKSAIPQVVDASPYIGRRSSRDQDNVLESKAPFIGSSRLGVLDRQNSRLPTGITLRIGVGCQTSTSFSLIGHDCNTGCNYVYFAICIYCTTY